MTRASRFGFGTRLFLASALVVVVCFLTAGAVAIAIAPGMFHHHLEMAGIGSDPGLLDHVDMAFRGTLLRALLPAAAVAVIVALAVSWWTAHRVQRSVERLADSAGEIAGGRFDTRVGANGLGREFDALAIAVNELARRLDETETVRQRMLADLGHEMRTPIATIDSHVEAIEDGMRTADDDTIAVLRDGTARLRRLAEDLGALSRVHEGSEAVRCEQTRARSLTTAAAAIAAPLYEAAGLELIVAGDDAPVLADPSRIGQVLGNLLDNARRHTPVGGAVTLSTRVDGHGVAFVVADTGEGIAPASIPHVFDRFYRADPARTRGDGGSGIGLTIARALVEAHGGTLSAANDDAHGGAVFTATLPAEGPSTGGANLNS